MRYRYRNSIWTYWYMMITVILGRLWCRIAHFRNHGFFIYTSEEKYCSICDNWYNKSPDVKNILSDEFVYVGKYDMEEEARVIVDIKTEGEKDEHTES